MTKKLMAALLMSFCLFLGSLDKAQAAQSPQEVQKAIAQTALKMGVDPFASNELMDLRGCRQAQHGVYLRSLTTRKQINSKS